jgi:hypothetical protein
MIVRKRRTSQFSVMPNEVFTDQRLSIGARWCLGYLLSKPDDWVVQPGDISRAGGVGREKGQQLVRELIEAGWIIREEVRAEDGTLQGYHYVVLDTPRQPQTEIPSPAPETGLPATVKPSLTKNGKTPKTEPTDKARARGALLPDDWSPKPETINSLMALGATDPSRLEWELGKFKAYWASASGQKATKRNWDQAFRVWMMKAIEEGRPHHGTRQQEPAHTIRSSLDAVNAVIDAELARFADGVHADISAQLAGHSAAGPGAQHGEHHPHLVP